MLFHGIVNSISGWIRVLTGVELLPETKVVKELNSGPYQPAFLQHFFPGRYRVEVRRIHSKYFDGYTSSSPITRADYDSEVIRWTQSSDQYSIRIKGSTGWLSSFKEIGLNIRNSKKMSKRLAELVRMSCAWTHRDASNPLNVEVIDHKALGFPDSHVDGISSISRSLAIECFLSNKQATKKWRAQQIRNVRKGKTVCVQYRMLTPRGEIKGNALVLPDSMMNGADIRTFEPNIKAEISTSGWQWVTIEPTYGAIPVKSDDLTHSIYRQVHGLYDDNTLMASLEGMLNQFFEDLKSGKRSEWLTKLSENANNILHDEEAVERYKSERGLVGLIQVAVAELEQLGIPVTSSQSLMFLTVNGLRKQLLGDNKPGNVWRDKTRHWFPVPWAYAAHVYTAEVLNLFGFNIKADMVGFYHEQTHGFVVPGKFFQDNLANHGGPDLDDTVKVHICNVVSNGKTTKMAFILRNPNDFGEWSMIPVSSDGPVFHTYGEIPTVHMDELVLKVPQFSKLQKSLNIGSLPCISQPRQLAPEFSLADEQRVRQVSQSFPAGVGGTVIPKMIWYGVTNDILRDLVAPNEDIIDALQQGQAGPEDVILIQKWIDNTFETLGKKLNFELDAFWYSTRLPKPYKEAGWKSGKSSDSSWVQLHLQRESVVRTALAEMTKWLNANVRMPEVLSSIQWTEQELKQAPAKLTAIRQLHYTVRNNNGSWPDVLSQVFQRSDENDGEEVTDRKILLLAYQSIMAKKTDSRVNYDQWLYAFDAKSDTLPYEYYLRALKRIQP